jgi:hypothetical protein
MMKSFIICSHRQMEDLDLKEIRLLDWIRLA